VRIHLFIPCFVDLFSPEVGRATARILTRLGHEVHCPEGQTCCGQPALNSGYFFDAERLAKRLFEVLGDGEPDAVVAPSGSCVAALREVGPRHLSLDREDLGRLYELSEFLTEKLGVIDLGAEFPHRVAWHDGCHPLRELGIRDGPRRLVRAARGATLLELSPAEECCGFGGTFAVKFDEVSAAMGMRKLRAIVATGAEYVASTEPSCLLQIRGLLERAGSGIRAIHLSQILDGGGDADE
jgi:L-lactate dehydrogenase complex protein LldE